MTKKKVTFAATAMIVVLLIEASILIANAKVCIALADLPVYRSTADGYQPMPYGIKAWRTFTALEQVDDDALKITRVMISNSGEYVTVREGGRQLTTNGCFPRGVDR